jgi:formiminoglutamase
MTPTVRYLEGQPWQGRADSKEHGDTRRWHNVVRPWTRGSAPGVALVGFACDEGVRRNGGRVGAARGPAIIRSVLANMAWHSSIGVLDAGDVCVESNANEPNCLEAGQEMLAMLVAQLLDEGQRVVVLGGGHEVAYASHMGMQAHLNARHAAMRVGIVNFDAHFDMRDTLPGNSGTPFMQIAKSCAGHDRPFRYLCLGVSESSNTMSLFETARQLDVTWRLDRDMCSWDVQATTQTLRTFLDGVDCVHLSVDLDVLPASVAPGVSAPAARGVSLEVIEHLLIETRACGKLLVTDIAECNPELDIDARTARVASRLVASLVT